MTTVQEEEYNQPGRSAFEERKRQALAEQAQLQFPDEVCPVPPVLQQGLELRAAAGK